MRRATAVSSAAHDKLLKKLEQNFQKLCMQYNKIKSFHGSDELSVKASLEKITHYAVFTAQTNLDVLKNFFAGSFFGTFFSKKVQKLIHKLTITQ